MDAGQSPDVRIMGGGPCEKPEVCPLNAIRAGCAARIKELVADEEVRHRLREIGFREEQTVKLVNSQATVVCQVCNARLAISARLAKQILVEPVTPRQSDGRASHKPVRSPG